RARSGARPAGATPPGLRRCSGRAAEAPSSRATCRHNRRAGSRGGQGSSGKYGEGQGVNPGEDGLRTSPFWWYSLLQSKSVGIIPRIELDDIDKRFVAALQAEGRLPIVDLADKVGLSPTPCQRRVKRLEEEGVIVRYAALVAAPAMGLGLQA